MVLHVITACDPRAECNNVRPAATTCCLFLRGDVVRCAGMFPISGADFEALNAAVERLTLNDASVSVKRENSAALGAGFRCGSVP